MANQYEEQLQRKIKQNLLTRSIGLFGATTIGVGALMGAGIYVLVGIAAGEAGPAVIISYILCALLAFLTTLMFAELAKRAPASGGGYAYVFNQLGNLGGFTTGWFLIVGSIFACALYAYGFAQYLANLFPFEIHGFFVRLAAVILVGVLALLSWLYGSKADKIQIILTWTNVGILAAFILSSLFEINIYRIEPFFPKGVGGVFGAISIIYISFFGFQLIANNTDEIKNPTVTIPKAMKLSMYISFVAYIAVALVSILAVPWKELAASSAPLSLVAQKSMGKFGWIFISIGGLVASASALNSTLVSQSRQLKAMGSDRFFPELLGEIDEKRNTPFLALLIGAVVTVIILFLFDLDFIAKSANFCLLASMIPVSFALRRLYRKNPEDMPKSKFMRYLPEIALVANIALLLSLDIVSLAFGQQIALVGGIIYFLYSRNRVKRGREGMNIKLGEDKFKLLNNGTRVMIPTRNTQGIHQLMSIAEILAGKKGELLPLSVVKSKSSNNFYDSLKEHSASSLDELMKSIESIDTENTKVNPILRASINESLGIAYAAQEESADKVVLRFENDFAKTDNPFIHELVDNLLSDLFVYKCAMSDKEFHPKRIGVLLSSKGKLELQIEAAVKIADRFDSEVCFYYQRSDSKKHKGRQDKLLLEAIDSFTTQTDAAYCVNYVNQKQLLDQMVTLSSSHDLFIIASTQKVNFLSRGKEPSVTGSIITAAMKCPVVLVHATSLVKKIIR